MYLTLVIVAAILLLLTVLFVRFMSASHDTFKKMGIDTPPTSWILGNFGQAIKYGVFEVQKVFYNQFKDKKVYGWYDSRRPTLVIRDLDMAKDIFVKNFNSFVDRHTLFDADLPFRDNLLNLRGDHWKHVRSIVSPTFSSGRIKQMSTHIERNSKILVDHLHSKMESGEEVELRDICSCFTLDVIASTGFGLEINTLKDPNNEFATQAKKVLNPNPFLFTLLLFLPELSTFFSKLNIPILPQKSMMYFAKVVDLAIEERKRDGLNGKINDFLDLVINAEVDATEKDGGHSGKELTRSEIHVTKFATEKDGGHSGKELTRSEIHAQAIVFIFAGYDTVATVLSFTLFLLAMHPDCCQKVQAEIDEKCGGEFPNYDTVQGLTFLDMCINEAIRLFPPGIFINRACVQDTEIHGVQIPKGMVVIIPVYAFHTDPDIFPEPEKFDPERFTPENKLSRHPYAHLPFGQGPRNCIGMRLALVELKIAIVAILGKLTPVPCSKSVYPVKLSKMQVKANDGLWVKFQLRNSV